jgi:DNA-binding PadR family transcriptional regulator
MSVRHAMLGLIAERPRHGYDLLLAFEALVGGAAVWEVKPAQIYATLARLEDAGQIVQEAVTQDGGPERHIYGITTSGLEELRTWFETPVSSDHQRDEVFVKLMVSLLRTEASAIDVIRVQRAALYRELHRIMDLRQQTDPTVDLAHALLWDKAVMHVEANLRWLDMVEARLDDIQKQPLPEPEPRPRGRPRGS